MASKDTRTRNERAGASHMYRSFGHRARLACRRTIASLLLLPVCLPAMAWAMPDGAPKLAAAASIGRCSASADFPNAVALSAWHGADDADTKVLATVQSTGRPSAPLALCVALVKAEGDDVYALLARLSAERMPLVDAPFDPVTHYYVDVDTIPYAYAAGNAAFAVRVTAEFNSTSTNASATTLYLFRRQGKQLALILETAIGHSLIDKTSDSNDSDTEERLVVRFDKRQHQGVYDLIVVDPHRPASAKRYLWNGSRYMQAQAAANANR